MISGRVLRFVLVAFALGLVILVGHWQYKRAWTYDLLGVRAYLGQPDLEFNLDSGLNGDGYYLSQYKVSPDVIAAFRVSLEAGPGRFPRVPDYRREWKCTSWRLTPMRDAEREEVEFALNGPPVEVGNVVLSRLSQAGSWYAQCVKRDDGRHVSNSELFLLDAARGVLTTAINNT